jgi:hypothetical protein
MEDFYYETDARSREVECSLIQCAAIYALYRQETLRLI